MRKVKQTKQQAFKELAEGTPLLALPAKANK